MVWGSLFRSRGGRGLAVACVGAAVAAKAMGVIDQAATPLQCQAPPAQNESPKGRPGGKDISQAKQKGAHLPPPPAAQKSKADDRLATLDIFGQGVAVGDNDPLPVVAMTDVKERSDPDIAVWVTYQDGVYDVTDFVAAHPGGVKRILLGAGKAIDPFWKVYTIHKRDHVQKILQSMRVATLREADLPPPEHLDDHEHGILAEPVRNAALLAHSEHPFNGETPGTLLANSAITPNGLFYVRNHFPVPNMMAGTTKKTADGKEETVPFCMEVGGTMGMAKECFTLDDLKSKFEKHTVDATLQCGGNRRDVIPSKTHGIPWQTGAIGTATWGGVWLRDLLCSVNASPIPHDWHVVLNGGDGDGGETYECSIPYGVAMSPWRDVLVAYEMNGEPLPPDHGYPLRCVVPGVVASRSVKWLKQVYCKVGESDSFWQQQDYKLFPNHNVKDADIPKLPSVYDTGVQSAITDSSRDENVVDVKGYAFAGGGSAISGLEVSLDGGSSWEDISDTLTSLPRSASQRQWAWSIFEYSRELEAPEGTEHPPITLCIRAKDERANFQPTSSSTNQRGLYWNAYPCVQL